MIVEELENEDIADEDEMSEALGELLTEFCEQLEKEEGMTRPIEEDDGDCESASFMWTDKAMKQIDNELNNLNAIGSKYFPYGGINIQSHMYREY